MVREPSVEPGSKAASTTDSTTDSTTESSEIRVEPAPSPWDGWTDVYLDWHREAYDGDGPFYAELASRHRGQVVEVGCGDGRLFDQVEPDVGLDTSQTMLDRAGANHPGVDLRYGDVGTYRLLTPATFTYAAMNVMAHLPDAAAQDEALANVRRNSGPGAVFAFDTLNTNEEEVHWRNGQVQLRHRSDDRIVFTAAESTGEGLSMRWHGIVDWIDSDGVVTRREHLPPIPLNPRRPDDWARSAVDAGWIVEDHWNGFDRSGPPADKGWQVLVLRNP